MPTRSPRLSGVTLLAAAVLVLLPALAWLQYSWLNQIADADRERRGRVLETAAAQLAQDLEGEIGRAAFALQLDPATVEQQAWANFANKYQTWAAGALTPEIVRGVYYVEPPDDDGAPASAPALRKWDAAGHTFTRVDWPPELQAVRQRFSPEVATLQVHGTARRDGPADDRPRSTRAREDLGLRGMRLLMPPGPAGDDQSIVLPVVRLTVHAGDGDLPPGPPDVKLLGFTIVHLDLEALGRELLPALVRRHLYDAEGESGYHIAVVSRDDPSRVVFESREGAAALASASPDISRPLLGRGGAFTFMSRGDGPGPAGRGELSRVELSRERGPAAPPSDDPPPGDALDRDVVVNLIEARRRDGSFTVQRTAFSGEGQWRLVMKHRAGSLEAAVAAARTRNFALSSGILALLATAIGLMVVSARRADRLARQQLEFVAAVSHELRTPVSVIGAAAGNLADGVVEEPSRVKKYGATIQAEARRLGETVERVLQLAGIAAGRAAAASTSVGVLEIVEDAVAAARSNQTATGVSIEVDIAPEFRQSPFDPGGVPHLVGDASALRSALQNLIGNAIKYGGDARWVRVSATAPSPRAVRIAVEDRGIGISPEDRRHIFEPFYRGREAVSRQIQGSGLGLHLVQRIVAAHGGTVTVHSEPRSGTRFVVELPAVRTVLQVKAGQSAPAPTA